MRRRTVLRGLGIIGLMAWAGVRPDRRVRAAPACVLSPSQTEGPFYFDPHLLRRDITEGRAGTPLSLRLQVVDAGTCAPIPDAVVDIWHADASGLYSGYPDQGDDGVDTSGQTFMRGLQVTDTNGSAEFATVYPGWYRGRATHVHFKVHVDDRTYVTSQLYFPDEVTQQVYESAPYAQRGQNTTTNATDGVLRPGQLAALQTSVEADGSAYVAALTIGIDLPPAPTATASPAATATPGAEDCAGDCSGDGAVTVDELVQGVNLVLGGTSPQGCVAFDRDGNALVTVSELVAAVNTLLRGCP